MTGRKNKIVELFCEFSIKKPIRKRFIILKYTYYVLTSEVITDKSQTIRGLDVLRHQGRGLSFPGNDLTDEFNKLFIKWPFHYEPELAQDQL